MSDIVPLVIESLSHDGRGIARSWNGSKYSPVVFVRGALPGQTVRARICKRAKTFWEGECLEIMSEQDLLPDICPHTRCGGCSLRRMPYAKQLFWKREILFSALQRIGKVDKELLNDLLGPCLTSNTTRQFRNKMEFAFGTNADGSLLLGLREGKSHTVTEATHCMLMDEATLDLRKKLEEKAMQIGLGPFLPGAVQNGLLRFAILRNGYFSEGKKLGAALLLVTSECGKRERVKIRTIAEDLLGEASPLQAFVHEERKSLDTLTAGEKRILTLSANGSEALFSLPLLGHFFTLDISSFFQVNLSAANLLAQTVMRFFSLAARDTTPDLLDLFCGVGAPGLLLAEQCARVTGIEVNPFSAKLAKENAANLTTTPYACHAAQVTKKLLAKLSLPKSFLCLLDPPRAGIDRESLAALRESAPAAIIYVSCNPATLARDILALTDNYELTALEAIDLFPHTAHVESVALLKHHSY